MPDAGKTWTIGVDVGGTKVAAGFVNAQGEIAQHTRTAMNPRGTAEEGLAMAPDVAEATIIPRPPKGREEPPVQISRLLHAHEIIIEEARSMARQAAAAGDDGTNDLLVSDVVRGNEKQVWFLSEHVVDVPLVRAD
jgi:hypothetical protein